MALADISWAILAALAGMGLWTCYSLAVKLVQQRRLSHTDPEAARTVARNLQKGLLGVAAVGSTAPFVGLFGTVWAVSHANAQGSAALITTAAGLAVSIVAVLGYNLLVSRTQAVLGRQPAETVL